VIPELADRFVGFYTRLIVGNPLLTVTLLMLVTLLLLKPALTFEQNMTRDIEVYLPEGEESTDLLLEVRQDWATDIILIYIETRNANDPERFNNLETHNITYVPTLKEIARLEREIDPRGQSMDQAKMPPDRGEIDNIIFTLSISTLIKEFNSTNSRFIEATEGKAFGGLSVEEYDDEQVNETGRYAIPSDQDRVDQIYEQTSGALQNFAIDTNDDGILDTAYIMFALKYSEGDNDARQAEIIERIQQAIDSRQSPARTEMTQTGLVVVLHEVTARLYEDLLAMLPISLIIVLGIMLWFHRNIFVVPVVLVPIFCALIWTLGLVRLSGVVLTPMIVAAGPILVGIGVDYGLHVANRIVEFREAGLPHRKATHNAMLTTGKATLLCALTDTIGFSALFISPIAPMRTVGLTMIIGVGCAFVLTVSMTPAIMKLTNYTRHHPKAWTGIARVSSQQWRVILLVVMLVTGYSLVRLSVMDQDIRGDESAPEDVASIRKLAEYSDKFEAGQTGILLVTGPPDRSKPAAKDLDVLDVMNGTTDELNNLTVINRNSGDSINVSAFSIVDFFKSAHIRIEIGQGSGEEPFFVFDGSFWDFLHHEFFDSWACQSETGLFYTCEELRKDMIDVFYDSFTGEMRAMLLTDDYTKALIYISMPYINIDDTALLVERTDDIAARYDTVYLRNLDAEMSQLTGGPPVTIAINEGIQNTQYKTIGLSLVLVLVTMILIFRSFRFGFITFLPILIVVLWYPATVHTGGTNLNIFTAMVGTIIIGIGIDNSIQITERVREEGTRPEGIRRAVEHTGQSVVEATFTTMGGVLAGVIISLYRTQFIGLRNFFALIIILVLFSLLMAVFALPSFYQALHHYSSKFGPRSWKVKR
jgi:predicted RND superfamily exporter protein